MVEELKRRTSNFFPHQEPLFGPRRALPGAPHEQRPDWVLPLPNFDHPFVGAQYSLSLNILGTSTPLGQHPFQAPPRADVDYDLASSFNGFRLSMDAPPRESRMSSSTTSETYDTYDANFDSNFDSNFESVFDSTFDSSTSTFIEPLKQHSIWSTPKEDTFVSPKLDLHLLLPPRSKPQNIYATKLNTPSFVPAVPKPKPLSEPLPTVKPVEIARPDSPVPKKKKLATMDIIIKLPPGKGQHQPIENYSRHVYEHLRTKDCPEDFCSTFYKRNSNGYMFTRESSNSLKVNSSGPKSWVTIKLRLGDCEPQKLKVDVKRLNVWKPINLNQPRIPKKKKRTLSRGS